LKHSSSLLEPAMGQLWLPIRSVSKKPSIRILIYLATIMILLCCIVVLHRLF
jgi:hypothetical protein